MFGCEAVVYAADDGGNVLQNGGGKAGIVVGVADCEATAMEVDEKRELLRGLGRWLSWVGCLRDVEE